MKAFKVENVMNFTALCHGNEESNIQFKLQ